MAGKTIKQRIALDGGKDLEKQLKELGAEGEKAFAKIRAAAIKADLAKFGASVKTFGSDLAAVGQRFALFGAGIAAAAAGAGAAVLGLAKSGADAADAAGKAAQKTGLQIDEYGRLEFAAKMANVSQEEFVAGMSKLNKAIGEAAQGTEAAGKAFEDTGVHVTRFGQKTKDATKPVKAAGDIFTKLGVKIKDANGKLRSNEAIVQDIAEAFARMPDGAIKSALAIEAFGKAGANLLPFLDQGKQGLRELGDEAAKLGILFTPEQFKLGDALGDSLDSVSTAIKAIKVQLGLLFAPIVLAGAQALTDIIVQNRDAILQLGAAAARITASVLGDLLHLLSGNTAAIKNPWILQWSIAIKQFGSDVSGVFNGLVLPAFKALREGAQFVADQINRVFGTDITAGELALGAAILSAAGAFTLLGSAVGVVVAGIGLLATLVGGIPLAIAAAAVTAGILIGIFWEDIKAGAAAAWQFIQDGAAVAWGAIVQGATDLWGQIVGGFQEGQQMAVDAFNAVVDAVVQTWDALRDRLGQISDAIVNRIFGSFSGLKERIAGIWNSIAETASAAFGRIGSFIDGMISRISAAIARLKELVGLGNSAGSSGGGGGGQGFARGGYLANGPGTSTSDSIMARLSVGEFVLQAKAVRRLGVNFLHALNQGADPLRAMRGFSIGGAVDNFNRSMSVPRFAGGGSVGIAAASKGSASGMTNVRLDFGLGAQDVFDLIGESHVVNKLHRFAVKSALQTTGRKPGRGK
ncbi:MULTISPECIES: hypothetical protein [unclassified Mesorhizobium]|uniref:hypothetical protein n=2 Tax=unclassified Mesorhizobium TaxID=325217 RepID=UPI0003CE36A2|nr:MULTISPECIES: hypothetical protein [unclassified Mesorhizobium]ESY16290.1 hypothetical protein X751_21685 [Mesorhizobium sp. LNJC395A00]WJI76581.1 hypothetical protein NLY37_07725 [Mesorhizobium sp. C395A]